MAEPTFFFDLASPYAYLAAERLAERPGLTWQPVLLGAIFAWRGWGSWAQTPARADNVAEIERRAARYGLPPVEWPAGWPANSLRAGRAALWAAENGRVREFALACYRRQFQHAEPIGELTTLQAAAADAGLEGDVLPEAIETPAIKNQLRQVTEVAWELGIAGVPSLMVGDTVFFGDDHLDEALASL